MKEPLISIIIPVYNAEKYLNRCLESVVNQTYKNLEIILIDDSSPDTCPEMCDEWAKRDERIKVFHIENNGVANARNKGVDNARGEYIGFVDSDDWCETDMFEKLYIVLSEFNADIAVSSYQINSETRGNDLMCLADKNTVMQSLCFGDYKYGVLWNKLFKKQIIENITFPNLVCSEDLVFNFYAFSNASVIAETELKLYHYFQNQSSIVHSKFGIGAFDALYAKEIILRETENTELEKHAINGLIDSCFVVLSGCIRNDFEDNIDYLINTIRKYKRNIYSDSLFGKTERFKTWLLLHHRKIFFRIIKMKG